MYGEDTDWQTVIARGRRSGFRLKEKRKVEKDRDVERSETSNSASPRSIDVMTKHRTAALQSTNERPSSSLRHVLFQFALLAMERSIEELYDLCELELDAEEVQCALQTLNIGAGDFQELLARVTLQGACPEVGDERGSKGIAWEVRTPRSRVMARSACATCNVDLFSNDEKVALSSKPESHDEKFDSNGEDMGGIRPPLLEPSITHLISPEPSTNYSDNDSSPREWADIVGRELNARERAEIEYSLAAKERAARLHSKLMSPKRYTRKTPREVFLAHEERHARAERHRTELELKRREKVLIANARLQDATDKIEDRRERLLNDMLVRHEQAYIAHKAHLSAIVKKASTESEKVQEINFINRLLEEEREKKLQSRLIRGEERRNTLIEMKKENARGLAALEAASDRRRQVEDEKKSRWAEKLNQKEEYLLSIQEERERERREREWQREEAVRRVEEIKEKQSKRTASKELELKKRLSESSERHNAYLADIKDRAASFAEKGKDAHERSPRRPDTSIEDSIQKASFHQVSENSSKPHHMSSKHGTSPKIAFEDSSTTQRVLERHSLNKRTKKACREILALLQIETSLYNITALQTAAIHLNCSGQDLVSINSRASKLLAKFSDAFVRNDIDTLERGLIDVIESLDHRSANNRRGKGGMTFLQNVGIANLVSWLTETTASMIFSMVDESVWPVSSISLSLKLLKKLFDLDNSVGAQNTIFALLSGEGVVKLVEAMCILFRIHAIDDTIATEGILEVIPTVLCEEVGLCHAFKDFPDLPRSLLQIQGNLSRYASCLGADTILLQFFADFKPPSHTSCIPLAVKDSLRVASAMAKFSTRSVDTILYGTIGLLMSMLLYANIARPGQFFDMQNAFTNESASQGHAIDACYSSLPLHFPETCLAALRVMVHIACKDECQFQSYLKSSTEYRLQFYHILSSLLSYGVGAFDRVGAASADIINEVIFLTGSFSRGNKDNAKMLGWSHSGTGLVERLCTLPVQYYMFPKLKAILFPTLVASCFEDELNTRILVENMSPQLLFNFVRDVGFSECFPRPKHPLPLWQSIL